MAYPRRHSEIVTGNQQQGYYEQILPIACETTAGNTVAEKLDVILSSLKKIENTVSNYGHPQRPPKPASVPGKGSPIAESPPPRPPKILDLKPSKKGKSLTKSQCDFLICQLKDVIAFLDENFDDEYDEKQNNVLTLQNVIRALSV